MDLGITHMPLEKALGPNGFNDIFVQNVGPSYAMIFKCVIVKPL
jgi:hypothetical protein